MINNEYKKINAIFCVCIETFQLQENHSLGKTRSKEMSVRPGIFKLDLSP